MRGREAMNKKSIKEILGTEFKNIEGRSAINKIMQEKEGYVEKAFHRNDIGDIALFWGDNGRGLCHIVERRRVTKQNLDKLLRNITEVINTGEGEYNEALDRVEITKGDYRVIVDFSDEIKSGKFVLTAFVRDDIWR
jgi:hypothetical protein